MALHVRATGGRIWPYVYGPVGGRSGPHVRARPGPSVRATLALVYGPGFCFFQTPLQPPFSCPFHRAPIILKLRAVPFEIVLGWQHPGVAIATARCFKLGQPPVRGLAFAVEAEATGICHDDEAVVLQFAEPAADAVAARPPPISSCASRCDRKIRPLFRCLKLHRRLRCM